MSFNAFPVPTVALGAALQQSGLVFNVRDFGAIGDGVTDDTTPVQTAINMASVSSAYGAGEVYFPAGRYAVSSISIPVPTVVRGAGLNTSTIFSRVAATATVVVPTAAAETVFDNLQINGNNLATYALQVSDNNSGVYQYACRARECNIFGGVTATVYIGTNRNRSQFIDCAVLHGAAAVYMQNSGDHRWANVDVGGTQAYNGYGLHLFNCAASYFMQCYFSGNQTGVQLDNNCYAVHIANCSIDTNSQNGFVQTGGSNVFLLGTTFFGNASSDATNYFDIRAQSSKLSVIGCGFFQQLTPAPDYSIFITAAADKVFWLGNNASAGKPPYTVDITNDFTRLWETETRLYRMPTLDPHVVGEWWANAGVVTVSAG